MNCALWLNKRKICSAAEIPQNLDIASLRGYLIAGSLLDWLDTNGGKEFADKLREVPLDSPDLNDKIAEVFGNSHVSFHKHFGGETQTVTVKDPMVCICDSGIGSYAKLSSYGSFLEVWEEILGSAGSGSISFAQLEQAFSSWNSFNISSATLASGGSYSFAERRFFENTSSFSFGSAGSFSFWEWLWKWFYGSFGSASSFSFGSAGSFSLWEWFWEWFYGSFGSASSFSFGSAGSFSLWEWFYAFFGSVSSFSSGSAGSFLFPEWLYSLFESTSSYPFGSGGSFSIDIPKNLPFDEYNLIMLKTLYDCPLDRYGYGIHNI